MCGKTDPVNRQAVHEFCLDSKNRDEDYLRCECNGWFLVTEGDQQTNYKLTPDEMRKLGQWLLDNAPVELIEG
jgi:hypothetical protein